MARRPSLRQLQEKQEQYAYYSIEATNNGTKIDGMLHETARNSTALRYLTMCVRFHHIITTRTQYYVLHTGNKTQFYTNRGCPVSAPLPKIVGFLQSS